MNWYETAFRKQYLDLYYHRSDEAAKGEASFAAGAMGIKEGARIVDVACGAGRHARALGALGMHVTGVDLSRDLLAAAAGVVRVRADMRALPFHGAFDGATSFFTSFGYFDDAGNADTMASIASALRPRGMFLLDFLNAAAVEAHLVPESREERDGRQYHVRRRIDDNRVVKDVLIEEEGLTLTYSESVRLYNHHELVQLLKAAGLSVVASYGAFDGRDFTTDAPRCILVARKTREA
ncbi:MAG TPA: class I SAM-dependent methyltransferase [Planctomycetota bacterium]|nr:class I SAM-dependent methyltransferase [Planctomycetota bacterium]